MKVTIPSARDETPVHVSVSRGSDNSDPEESKITNIRFFIFKSDENKLEKYQDVIIHNDGTSSNPDWNPVDNTLHLVVSPGPKRVYCIANWATTPTGEMPEITNQTVTDTASLLAMTRWYITNLPALPPVMSGRLAFNISGKEQKIKFSLVRQVSRIEIFPMISPVIQAAGIELTIEGVKFARLPDRAFVFDRYPSLVPAGNRWEQADFTGTRSAPVTATTIAGAVRYPVAYFLPEDLATSGPVATVMIIKALYGGKTVYYTVPLGENLSGTNALRRNHCYNYYLTISGVGSPSAIVSARRQVDNLAFSNIHVEHVEINQP